MVGLADMQIELRKLQGTFFYHKIPSRWPKGNSILSSVLASFPAVSKRQHNKSYNFI